MDENKDCTGTQSTRLLLPLITTKLYMEQFDPGIGDLNVHEKNDLPVRWTLAQILVAQQQSTHKNCGFYALYNAISSLAAVGAICSSRSTQTNEFISVPQSLEEGLSWLTNHNEAFQLFCASLKTYLFSTTSVSTKTEDCSVAEYILERSELAELLTIDEFQSVLAWTELGVNDLEKFQSIFSRCSSYSTVVQKCFLLGTVDHYTAVLLNKPENSLHGEIIFMDSFNQSILSMESAGDVWAYATETGALWEKLPKKEPISDVMVAYERQIRFMRCEQLRDRIRTIVNCARGVVTMQEWYIGGQVKSLEDSFNRYARDWNDSPPMPYDTASISAPISLPHALDWMGNYFPAALIRTRDIPLLKTVGVQHISRTHRKRVIYMINEFETFVRSLHEDSQYLVEELLSVFRELRDCVSLEHVDTTEQSDITHYDGLNLTGNEYSLSRFMWAMESQSPKINDSLVLRSVFSVQESIDGWCQDNIRKQEVLLLGVGGIGCNIAQHLCRLGVGRLYIVDNDVVEVSNLNRQTLFRRNDVGRRKVSAAYDTLTCLHSLCTEVVPLHLDVVLEWHRVVTLAQRCTCIFNCVDVGDSLDVAVASLCVRLKIGYYSASSFSNSWIADVYPSTQPCYVCHNATNSINPQIIPAHILQHGSLEFLPRDSRDEHQTVGSSALAASCGASACVAGFLAFLQGYPTRHWSRGDVMSGETFPFTMEGNLECRICGDFVSTLFPNNVLLYNGDSTVRMGPLGGSFSAFRSGSLSLPIDTEVMKRQVQNARELLEPLQLNSGSFFLPCPPAPCPVEHYPTKMLSDIEVLPTIKKSKIPDWAFTPHVKCGSGGRLAIQSGQRSAIIPLEGEWHLRLKGCGNIDGASNISFPFPGFSALQMPRKDGFEVRGCSYWHTVLREQYITQRLIDYVKECQNSTDIEFANIPLGWYRYSVPSLSTNVAPELSKYCSMFATKGDRRLNTHLISGLLILAPLLLETDLDVHSRLLHEMERRGRCDGDRVVRPTWCACLSGLDDKRKPLMDMVSFPMHVSAPTSTAVIETCIYPQNNRGELSCWRQNICSELCTQLEEILQNLNQSVDPGGNEQRSILGCLFWRLGVEAGYWLRTVHSAGIVWGYFFDHDEFIPHCNAHPNNLIVLPPGKNARQLLAPLDFDLAYTRDEYLMWRAGQCGAENENEANAEADAHFDDYIRTEYREMERALGGEAANSGVSHGESASDIQWALRDTLVMGYQEGYKCSASPYDTIIPQRISIDLEKLLTVLVELALILTARVPA